MIKKLEEQLKFLQLEMDDIQKSWAKEIKEVEDQNPNISDEKLEKEFERVAERYADQMLDNSYAQEEIMNEIEKIKEEERKKQYKD